MRKIPVVRAYYEDTSGDEHRESFCEGEGGKFKKLLAKYPKARLTTRLIDRVLSKEEAERMLKK